MQFGKQIGGTTSVNAMLWVCGNNRDYNFWNASGADGWDYESLLPFFRKIENNIGPNVNLKYHGKGGPLTISTYKDADPFIQTIESGWTDLGYEIVPDYNSENYNGITRLQVSVENGQRQNSYQGYLKPAKERKNLFFATHALVTKVLFEGDTATGVEVSTGLKDCATIQFQAKKEVILSAGGFGSAKILLQSGVGPAGHLGNLGIPLVKDLPVGQNFQDHVTGVNWMTINPEAVAQSFFDVLIDAGKYLFYRGGNFAQMGTMHADAFINITDPTATYPDVQNIMYRFERKQQYFAEILGNFGYNDEIITQLVAINEDHQLLMTWVTVVKPKSVGSVELRGTDPNLPLKIHSGFFTDEEGYDHETMSRGMLKLVELTKTESWKNVAAEFVNFNLSDCPFDPESLDYWRCYVRHFSASEWHFTGTNRMGAASDPTAVVDPFLKVRGLNNLRVVDAGVMREVPSGNTQCPSYMLAEKGSDMIKKTHNL